MSGQRGERADQMSKPLGVSSCRINTWISWDAGSKDCVLNSSFGTNPGKSSKTFGDLQEQEASGLTQGWGQNGYSHSAPGLGLLLTVLFSIPPPSEEIRMDEYLQTVQ